VLLIGFLSEVMVLKTIYREQVLENIPNYRISILALVVVDLCK
jgi:hypothetical protein